MERLWPLGRVPRRSRPRVMELVWGRAGGRQRIVRRSATAASWLWRAGAVAAGMERHAGRERGAGARRGARSGRGSGAAVAGVRRAQGLAQRRSPAQRTREPQLPATAALSNLRSLLRSEASSALKARRASKCSESPASQRPLPWCDRRTSTVLDSGSAESPARLTRRSPSAGRMGFRASSTSTRPRSTVRVLVHTPS